MEVPRRPFVSGMANEYQSAKMTLYGQSPELTSKPGIRQAPAIPDYRHRRPSASRLFIRWRDWLSHRAGHPPVRGNCHGSRLHHRGFARLGQADFTGMACHSDRAGDAPYGRVLQLPSGRSGSHGRTSRSPASTKFQQIDNRLKRGRVIEFQALERLSRVLRASA